MKIQGQQALCVGVLTSLELVSPFTPVDVCIPLSFFFLFSFLSLSLYVTEELKIHKYELLLYLFTPFNRAVSSV